MTISALSVWENTPQIMVGNLLGASLVILLLVIPLLGIIGNGVKIPSTLGKTQLLITLLTILTPAILSADRRLTLVEGGILVVSYASLFVVFSIKQSLWQKVQSSVTTHPRFGSKILIKALLGVFLIVVSSHQIINTTLLFAQMLHISPFFIGIIVIALGTNIPEFSLIIRSLLARKADIALGDYLGSAAANTLILGASVLLYGRTIDIPNHAWQRIGVLVLGLIMFFIFARSKKTLSRIESCGLLVLYLAFVYMEVMIVF